MARQRLPIRFQGFIRFTQLSESPQEPDNRAIRTDKSPLSKVPQPEFFSAVRGFPHAALPIGR